MYSSAIILALAAIGASAAPVAQKDAPDHYYEGYLEPYMTYHTRYITIGCSGQQGSQFFTDCCSPMLADEVLEEARLPYCRPNGTETATVSAWFASASGEAPVQTESADYDAQSEYSHALPSAAAVAQEASSSAEPTTTSTWSAEPEPTQEAPKEESSGSSPSGDVKTGGFATYFHQNGNAGACGNYNSDSDFGIAIDSNGYWGNDFSQGSDLCGRVINIKNTNNGKTVTATVWDVCPTCNNGNSLDLSVGAFNQIATEAEGMVPIEWSFA